MDSQLVPPSFIQQHRHIPEEIIIQILSRLPVKSLLRFKCVSKAWRSSISDPKFTLSSSHRHLQLAFQSGDGDNDVLYSVDAIEEVSSRDVLLPKPMVFNYDDNNTSKSIAASIESTHILGSCNGLLLVSHFTDLFLWNPATRQCRKVLSIQMNVPGKYSFWVASGLCYDSYSDDYKAIMMHRRLATTTLVSCRRKYWATKIDRFANQDNSEMLHTGPLVNEKLHWVITSFTNGNTHAETLKQIIYFDPRADEFIELPIPLLPNDGRHISGILGLGVLEGCLCMARFMCGRRDEVEYYHNSELQPAHNYICRAAHDFEVLVMKEHGMGESWTSAFIMSNVFGLSLTRPVSFMYNSLVPLCLTKNGEVLFSVHRNNLLVYDPVEMSQRNIPFPRNHFSLCKAMDESLALYVESLASPVAYVHDEDWILEGPNALDLLRYIGPWDWDWDWK